jgi:TonB family protein
MPKAWKDWEGRFLNEEFRLGEHLGGSEAAGVFLTTFESRKAAIKLMPVAAGDQAAAEAELSRLKSARELSHPHLLQIFQVGRTKLENTELLFAVMENAEEDLSQILPNRALTAEEAREMLQPVLDALGYLHEKGFVHGHLTPENVMAIGDQVKLSSDGIVRSGVRRGTAEQSSDYDAPEVARGEISPASDVWSLGMLLGTALTQRVPGLDVKGEPVLLEEVPPPFGEIMRRCVRREASARCSLADIAARLGFAAPQPVVSKAELQPTAGPRAAARAATGPQVVRAARQTGAAPQNFAKKQRSNMSAYVAVAAVLVIVGVLLGPRLFRGAALDSHAAHSQRAESKPNARAKSAAARVRNEAGSGQTAAAESAQGNLQASAEKSEKAPAAPEKASRRLTPGQVAQQVVPDVPKSARDTIRGTVRVGVRISVDSAGNVTEADLDSPGPSKYFANLALEAAQQWKFDPPKMAGRNVLSDWLLHFQFTGQGTRVIPVQSDP